MTTATKAGGAVLKPCPFCGVVPVIERCADTHDRVYGPRKWWGVHCRSTLNLGGTCAVEIRPQASIEAAVTRWNTRAPAQAKQIDVDAVMRLADDYAGENYKAERFGMHYCHDRDAAREALRAAVTKDRT